MNPPTPAFTLDVDLTNPGQFLACCGLLELASRLAPEAVGWFGEHSFSLSTNPDDILSRLKDCKIAARELGQEEFLARAPAHSTPKSSNTLNPVHLGAPFALEIDWWLKPSPLRTLKLWAGSMVPARIVVALQMCVKTSMARRPGLTFRERLVETSTVEVSPFHFAGTKSRHALDLGFSIDEVKDLKLMHQPLIELLAFIALQRFRPAPSRDWLRFAAWSTPLPATVAAAVAGGGIDSLILATIAFQVIDRDDHGHKQLSQANKETPCLNSASTTTCLRKTARRP
jgi:CRISPR-associated protein Csb3